MIDGQRVRFVYRHHVENPADILPALALEAAAHQGRFWEMHDALVRVHGDLDAASVYATADAIGLDPEAFTLRIASGDDTIRIDDDNLDVEEIEAGGEPIVYLEGRRIPGSINRWRLVESIDGVIREDFAELED